MKKDLLNHHTALRSKSLGALGELLAIKALVDNGFNGIRNLNDGKRNHPFADLYAERNNEKFVISVKTRNRYQSNGKLNSRYNLGNNSENKAKGAEATFNAKAAWMAISIFDDVFSIYFGEFAALKLNTGIPMNEASLKNYECLVNERYHGIDFSHYKNVYEPRD